ncbi:MAG: chemotaxis protein CheX [Geobacteraceae bacterium]|nr:chemotaxis protein CheX [Geobacteraceae bacterium]
MDLQKNITDATTEIFETMIMVDINAGDPILEKINNFKCSVSGVIGLAGSCKGMLAIHLPDKVAMSITGSFLGMDVTEVDDDVTDAIGELANMVAGNIKMILDEAGNNVTVSIPSCVHGEEYSMDTVSDSQRVVIPFNIESGRFLVELQIKN